MLSFLLLLLFYTDHVEDIFEKCKLKLLMIQKFPDAIMEHGVRCSLKYDVIIILA